MDRKELLILVLVAALAGACVEHYEYHHLTDSLAPADTAADGVHADGIGDVLPEDLADLAPTDVDVVGELPVPDADAADEELPDLADDLEAGELPCTGPECGCVPDCEGRECGEDGCGGNCWTEGEECDDSNPCTADTCTDGQCGHEALDGEECDDGNPCTVLEGTCDEDQCVAPFLPVNLIDNVETCPCVDDNGCIPLDAAPCDALHLLCDLEEGDDTPPHCAFYDLGKPDCDDGIACTFDHCEEGEGCVHDADDGLCDDSNPCTTGTCDAVLDCQQAANNEGECDDGNACTVGDYCDAGLCQSGGEALDCDDENPCTDDACIEESGCSNENNTAPCDDGVSCTENDQCSGGMCAGEQKDCDDSNSCTLDSCVEETGECANAPLPEVPAASCDDDDACTLNDVCSGGECVGTPLDCDDGNPCTDDSCQGGTGCLYVNNEAACDDGNVCTVGDQCQLGTCQPGTEVAAECQDYDHDGIMNSEDSCPYAFDLQELDLDGNTVPDACTPLAGSFPMRRALLLMVDGQDSPARRTHEPVDIPLANGILDYSVQAFFPLDGDASAKVTGGDGDKALLIGTSPTDGAFGDPGGALAFDGVGDAVVFPAALFMNRGTICQWMKTNQGTTSASGRLEADGRGAFFRFDPQEQRATVYLANSAADAFEATSTATLGALWDGKWHHICMEWDTTLPGASFYLDGLRHGSEMVQTGTPDISQTVFEEWVLGALYKEDLDGTTLHYGGALDELLAFGRSVTLPELEVYLASGTSYATPTVPGAQKDFDDVRLLETFVPGAGTVPLVRRHRIVGVRPHSDSPCPTSSLTSDLPLREDLCGVLAYWPLGEHTDDMAGSYDLEPMNDGGYPMRGRFGHEGGAMWFGQQSYLKAPTMGTEKGLNDASLSLEAWYYLEGKSSEDGGTLLGHPFEGNQMAFALHVNADGTLSCRMTTAMGFANPSAATGVGEWHHAGCSYDGTHVSLYVDGFLAQQEPLEGDLKASDLPVYVGAGGTDPAVSFRGALDDVLIHDTRKGPAYFLQRATPRVPALRFLASTEVGKPGDGSFPARSYRLAWGNEDAFFQSSHVSGFSGTTPCYGLVTECLGTVGWWTFDEGRGNVAADTSLAARHAEFGAGALLTMGETGYAIALDGQNGELMVDYSAGLQLNRFTIEARIKTPAQQEEGVLVSRGRDGDPEAHNYRLAITAGGAAVTSYEGAGGTPDIKAKGGDGEIPAGEWTTVAARLDGENLHALVNGVVSATTAADADPGTSTRDLVFGADTQTTGAHYDHFGGAIDSLRLTNRALEEDELLHFPPFAAKLGGFEGASGQPLDSDGDGIADDGNGSLIIGDAPCLGGQTVGCDDNAPGVPNGDQADEDEDGVGTVIDNCPESYNPDQSDDNGDGVGDVCDPVFLTDWDHDGLAGMEDPCPYAFDGAHWDKNDNGKPDLCEQDTKGYTSSRHIWLSADGDPKSRRTHELVEVPLRNGWLDASCRLYVDFDGELTDGSPQNIGAFTEINGPVLYENGLDPSLAQAGKFSGSNCLQVPEPFTYPVRGFTIMAWVMGGGEAVLFDDGGGAGSSANGMKLTVENLGASISFITGDDNGKCVGSAVLTPFPWGEWYHVAATFQKGSWQIFVNGNLANYGTCAVTEVVDDGRAAAVSCDNDDYASNFKAQRMDELLVFSRPLSPAEIAAYWDSRRPFGSTLVYDAQPDFDDVRIMEHPDQGEMGNSFLTRSRLVGVRRHSDSPCPSYAPDSTLGHREDLCSVGAYWPLDGNGYEATQGNGSPLTAQQGEMPYWNSYGRFGSPDGGVRFADRREGMKVPSNDAINPDWGSFSFETWIRFPPPQAGSVLHPISKKGFTSTEGYQLSYTVSSGVFTCEFFGGSGKTVVVSGQEHPVQDDRWHHVACVLDRGDGDIRASLYIDGLMVKQVAPGAGALLSLNNNDPLRIGWANADGMIYMDMDEVLYHSVAKSGDYFYHRTHPALPTVRFLANSTTVNHGNDANPSYPMRNYELHTGHTEASLAVPLVEPVGGGSTCHGLLSPCMGTVGWWRLEEGFGDFVADSGQNQLHGTRSGAMYWTSGADGFGLGNNGSPGYVSVMPNGVLEQPEGTWEVVFRPGFDIQGSSPMVMGLLSRDAAGANNDYHLRFLTSGKLHFALETTGGQLTSTSPKNGWSMHQDYVASIHAGADGVSLLVDGYPQGENGTANDGFGGAGNLLVLGAHSHAQHYFSGTFSQFRYSSRKLEPDEQLHVPPLKATLESL